MGPEVFRAIHLCCGYPGHLDDVDYPKADKEAYKIIADKLDAAMFDAGNLYGEVQQILSCASIWMP